MATDYAREALRCAEAMLKATDPALREQLAQERELWLSLERQRAAASALTAALGVDLKEQS